MGANNRHFKLNTHEWGSKAKKQAKHRVKTAMKEDLVRQYLGDMTGSYTDMFGFERQEYDNSRLYLIQNVGQYREDILEFLEQYDEDITIIDKNGIFKYIEVGIDNLKIIDKLAKELKDIFDCNFVKDSGC